MIALDTNILARFLLNDDAEQFRAAWDLLSQPGPYTAPPTVILELAWVLKINDCSREEIPKGLRALIGLPNFIPQQYQAVLYALRWFESGMDFADALHLALSEAEETLFTFDRDFTRSAMQAQAFPNVRVVRRLAGMANKTDEQS
jgi:predicted nucleic-acid-binding protein